MSENAILAAAAQLAEGGPASPRPSRAEPAPEPQGASEGPDETSDEGGEEVEAPAGPEGDEEPAKKPDDEDEDLDEDTFKKKKAQLDRAHARLSTKKREAARQIASQRAELERERATIKREREAASQYLQSSVSKIEKFDRLVALAKEGDDALIDELGIDLEKLTLRYLERGTPQATERKAKSEIETLRAEMAAEKAARAEADRQNQDRQHQAWRHDQSRQFVQFAVDKADNYPYAATAVESNAQGVADIAWKLRDLAAERGIRIGGEALLAEVESYYEGLAQQHLQLHSKVQARRMPIGEQATTQKPARGLASGPRRNPSATPRTESLSDDERRFKAARELRQAARR